MGSLLTNQEAGGSGRRAALRYSFRHKLGSLSGLIASSVLAFGYVLVNIALHTKNAR